MGSNTLNRKLENLETYWGGKTSAVTDSADNTISGDNTLSGANTISGATTISSTTTHSGDLKVTGDLFSTVLVEDHTAADTLTAAESGSVHTNAGATEQIAITLPTAAAGLQFTFVPMAAQNLVVTANTGDLLHNGGTTAATLTANAAGEFLDVVAVDAQYWVVRGKEGTWT
jgi:hypothetical protein